ncbi:hypothetical protein [Neokomagataea thailandica]|nr:MULTISPECIES: hypothetical protein [Neokomagataea]
MAPDHPISTAIEAQKYTRRIARRITGETHCTAYDGADLMMEGKGKAWRKDVIPNGVCVESYAADSTHTP